MALYIKRPRLDEKRIGQGMPSVYMYFLDISSINMYQIKIMNTGTLFIFAV